MNKITCVRLGVALSVATGLHALLFVVFPQHSKSTGLGGDIMQVEMLTGQKKVVKISRHKLKKQPNKELVKNKQHVLTIKKEDENFSQDNVKKVDREIARQVDNQISYEMASQDAQQLILSKVKYPRQARRRGWQGRAEFVFAIYEQNIQHITMLVSTGHPILDRAAQSGFYAIQNIPLSNGSYRMPVVFRLQ